MNNSILVNHQEYESLKKIQNEFRKQQQQLEQQQMQLKQQQQQQQPAVNRATGGLQGLNVLKHQAIQRENTERQEVLDPPGEEKKDLPREEEEESVPISLLEEEGGGGKRHWEHEHEEALQDLSVPFLPAAQWREATTFLRHLLQHPQVALRGGMLVVKGRGIGQLAVVVHALFGGGPKSPAVKHKSFFFQFLRQYGMKSGTGKQTSSTARRRREHKTDEKKKSEKKHKKPSKTLPSQPSQINPHVYSLLN